MKTPLYLKIENHIFDKLQVIDAPTLKWLKEKQGFKKVSIFQIKKTFKPLNKNIFLDFIPSPNWFVNPSRLLSIHGLSHALRVMLFSYIICDIKNIKNYEKYLIPALIHDILREFDIDDPNHGERASRWFLENSGLFGNLNKKEIEEISVAIKYHDIEYNFIPEDILLKFGNMIKVLKCADALDRFRLPKENWFPKKEVFKIDLPDKIFELSKRLVYETEDLIINKNLTPFMAVFQISSKLNLIT